MLLGDDASPGVVKLELTSENDLFFHYTHTLDVTGKGSGGCGALDYWRNRTAVWTENGTYSSCFYSGAPPRGSPTQFFGHA